MKGVHVRVESPLTLGDWTVSQCRWSGGPLFPSASAASHPQPCPALPCRTRAEPQPEMSAGQVDPCRGQSKEEKTFGPRQWPAFSLEGLAQVPVRRAWEANQASCLDAISYRQALGICMQMYHNATLVIFQSHNFVF